PSGILGEDAGGVVVRAVRALSDEVGEDIAVLDDLCLCEYTAHGRCGPLDTAGPVDTDLTLERYASVATAQAEAGATVVAPSGMMDGQVAAIRAGLDRTGHTQVPILAYAAKYASVFYGPFREAAEGAPQFGDRSGYQQDPANAREALREVALDVAEGADMVMVKPGLAYLDIVAKVAESSPVPVSAYQVSGEYAMIE